MKKIIFIKPEQVDAFASSIAKWQAIVDSGGEKCGIGSEGCGLCEFDDKICAEKKTLSCYTCPIAKDVEQTHCDGTPYSDYSEEWFCSDTDTNILLIHAKAELSYLLDLQSRCVVDNDLKY